jgi:hypothetical protein
VAFGDVAGVAVDSASIYATFPVEKVVRRYGKHSHTYQGVVVAETVLVPSEIVVAGAQVFFLQQSPDRSADVLTRITSAGQVEDVATGLVNAAGLMGTSTNVFWTAEPSPAANRAIYRLNATGGAPVLFAPDQYLARWVHANDTSVYWNLGGPARISTCDAAASAPCTPVVHVSSEASPVAALVGAGEELYWLAGWPPAVRRRTGSGETETLVDPGTAQSPSALAADGNALYWGYFTVSPAWTTHVWAVNPDGAAPRELCTAGGQGVQSMTTDGVSVYFSTNQALYRMRLR